MFAFCFDRGLNGYGLMLTRLVVVTVSIYGLFLIFRILRFQSDAPWAVRLIPRVLLVGAGGWLLAQFAISVYLLTTDCSTSLGAVTRTMYGNALIWSQATFMLMISQGLGYRKKVAQKMRDWPDPHVSAGKAIEKAISDLSEADQNVVIEKFEEDDNVG